MKRKFVLIAVEPKTRSLLKKIAEDRRTNLYQLLLTLAEQSEKILPKIVNIDTITNSSEK